MCLREGQDSEIDCPCHYLAQHLFCCKALRHHAHARCACDRAKWKPTKVYVLRDMCVSVKTIDSLRASSSLHYCHTAVRMPAVRMPAATALCSCWMHALHLQTPAFIYVFDILFTTFLYTALYIFFLFFLQDVDI